MRRVFNRCLTRVDEKRKASQAHSQKHKGKGIAKKNLGNKPPVKLYASDQGKNESRRKEKTYNAQTDEALQDTLLIAPE